MDKTLMYKARINTLKSRAGKDNDRIIAKLMRKLRKEEEKNNA